MKILLVCVTVGWLIAVVYTQEQPEIKVQANAGQGSPSGRKSRITTPTMPFNEEYLEKSKRIFHAHQILFAPLTQFVKGRIDVSQKEDFNMILNELKNKYAQYFNSRLVSGATLRMTPKPAPKRDHFFQIYHQRNEVCHQSYSIECYESDKEVLIDVSRYLADYAIGLDKNLLINSVIEALNYGGTTMRSSRSIDCARYSDSNGTAIRYPNRRKDSRGSSSISTTARPQSRMG